MNPEFRCALLCGMPKDAPDYVPSPSVTGPKAPEAWERNWAWRAKMALSAVKDHPGASAATVAKRLGLDYHDVRGSLRALVRDGELRMVDGRKGTPRYWPVATWKVTAERERASKVSRVLAFVKANPLTTCAQIARGTGLGPTPTVRVLRDAVDRGRVRREQGSETRYALTERGRR